MSSFYLASFSFNLVITLQLCQSACLYTFFIHILQKESISKEPSPMNITTAAVIINILLMGKDLQSLCSYHLAEKKIPSIHGHTMGYKLEQFIFDAFPYAPSTALFEVITSFWTNL